MLREQTVPAPDTDIEWTGGCTDGLAHGPGTKTYLRSGVSTLAWSASFDRGIPVGTWTGQFLQPGERKQMEIQFDPNGDVLRRQKILYTNGASYEGETDSTTGRTLGRPHGSGLIRYADGGEYQGNFVDGSREGSGSLRFPTREAANSAVRYVGEFRANAPNGRGVMEYRDGARYSGEWVEGKRRGEGKLAHQNGTTVEGQWADDHPVQATIRYAPSDNPGSALSYTGSFKDGKFSGNGTMNFANGGLYVGQWLDGARHGQGRLTGPGGEVYEGTWERNTRSGRGDWTLPRSNNPGAQVRYVGEFRDGMPNGQGTIEWANGARYSGSYYTTVTYNGPTGNLCGYSLAFPGDDLLLGEFGMNLANNDAEGCTMEFMAPVPVPRASWATRTKKAALTPATKWLMLNTPGNPAGGTYSADELREIAAVLDRHPKVWLLSDDIYEHVIFDGRTFTKFAGNPIIKQVTPGNRDPKVIWHEPTKQWVMVLYVELPAKAPAGPNSKPGPRHTIHFFTSKNLLDWSLASVSDGYYECPDLFELPVDGKPDQKKWVLTAASSEYQVGTFDGKNFTPETDKLPGHRGRGFYAAQTYSNAPEGRCVQIGWGQGITFGALPFNQQMVIPVTLSLRQTGAGPRLHAAPVAELDQIVGRLISGVLVVRDHRR